MKKPGQLDAAPNNPDPDFSLRHLLRFACVALLLVGCATTGQRSGCPSDPECIPTGAIEDARVSKLHDSRTWVGPDELELDPIQFGMEAEIPIEGADAKLLGPSPEDALRSIAAKIWLIDHAQYTIDAAYYIFKQDLIGQAMIGALCNAVRRGVDVRLMVDSIGSVHPTHGLLKSLVGCSDGAGFMRNEIGQLTNRQARAQVVIFNALSRVFVNVNRRSHDKMLVVDGHFADKAYVMTGGRNISLDYYGLKADGSLNPDAFKDLEILLKPGAAGRDDDITVGSVAEIYMSVLLLNEGNKLLNPWSAYRSEAEKARQALATLRGFDNFKRYYDEMDSWLADGFLPADVRLAHELQNLRSTDVVEKFAENLDSNSNSIVALLERIQREAEQIKTIRIVSPYLFLSRYTDDSGEVKHDGAVVLKDWLEEDPQRRIEVITNSSLTSDNFFAQSIIDIDMAPRLLLDDEMKAAWQGETWEGETNPEIVESETWKQMIANPRIRIYQLGRLDSELLGGNAHYGKLHAKYITTEAVAFVGTTNLDYRSRLFNNEMGFFLRGEALQNRLVDIFEGLKRQSYLWGSPEWLQMRDELRRTGTIKGSRLHRQRKTFNGLRGFGLDWQI